MYTDAMRRAYRRVPMPPQRLTVDVVDMNDFLVLQFYWHEWIKFSQKEIDDAWAYLEGVRAALQSEGALVTYGPIKTPGT